MSGWYGSFIDKVRRKKSQQVGFTAAPAAYLNMNIEEENMVSEIATQIHENSKILTRKLTAIKLAINRLVASGILVATYGVAAKILEAAK